MRKRLLSIAGALIAVDAAAAGALYWAFPVRVSIFAGLTRNYILSWSAPRSRTTTETNPAYHGPASLALSSAAEAVLPGPSAADWPSYNRILTSERSSQLSQITTENIGKLKVLSAYDVGEFAAFASGLIIVEDALIGTIESDTFSLNPATGIITYMVYGSQKVAVASGFTHIASPTKIGTAEVVVLGIDSASASQ